MKRNWRETEKVLSRIKDPCWCWSSYKYLKTSPAEELKLLEYISCLLYCSKGKIRFHVSNTTCFYATCAPNGLPNKTGRGQQMHSIRATSAVVACRHRSWPWTGSWVEENNNDNSSQLFNVDFQKKDRSVNAGVTYIYMIPFKICTFLYASYLFCLHICTLGPPYMLGKFLNHLVISHIFPTVLHFGIGPL